MIRIPLSPRTVRFAAGAVVGLALGILHGATLVVQSQADVATQAESKVVKLYGAGGFRGLEEYQTGVLVSDDGYILTAWSHVLDVDEVVVILSDGRRFEGRLVGHDPRIEIAVVKIDVELAPSFDLDEVTDLARPGEMIMALTNLYGVATGNEPVSIQQGTITAVGPLSEERTGGRLPFKGSVYIIDAMTGNPGAAGGALIDRQGRLLGLIGKDLKREDLNIWVNFAIPIPELRQSVEDIRAGRLLAGRVDEGRPAPGEPMSLELLGITLVPDVLGKTPAYIDRIQPGSPADVAGLRPDDLILFVDDRLVACCRHVVDEIGWIHRDDPLQLTVQRGTETLTVELEVRP